MPSKPIPKGVKNPPRKRVRVRCLGPGGEHTFMSDDPIRHRVCADCVVKIRALSYWERRRPMEIAGDDKSRPKHE